MKSVHAHQQSLYAAFAATGPLAAKREVAPLRRFSVSLQKDDTRVLEGIEDGVTVRCRRGSVWIVQEGDCGDVVLGPRQSYEPDCGDTLRLVALAPCELEISFAEDVLMHA